MSRIAKPIRKLEVGKVYGYWKVLEKIDGKYVLCRCVCGKEKPIQISHLRFGYSKSCGCMVGPRLQRMALVAGRSQYPWAMKLSRIGGSLCPFLSIIILAL